MREKAADAELVTWGIPFIQQHQGHAMQFMGVRSDAVIAFLKDSKLHQRFKAPGLHQSFL